MFSYILFALISTICTFIICSTIARFFYKEEIDMTECALTLNMVIMGILAYIWYDSPKYYPILAGMLASLFVGMKKIYILGLERDKQKK